MRTVKQLTEDRTQKLEAANALVAKATAEVRDMTAEENTQFDSLVAEAEALVPHIKRAIEIEKLASERNFAPVTAVHGGPAGNKVLSTNDQRDLNKFDLGGLIKDAVQGRKAEGVNAEILTEGLNEARAAGAPIQGNIVLPYSVFVCDTDGRDLVRESIERNRRNRNRRDMSATGTTSVTGDQGGLTIQTMLGQLYEALYNRIVLAGLGATTITNMVGNYQIPRISDTDDPAFKSESGSADESSPTVSAVTLSPKRLPTYIEMSNQLMLQSNYNIQQVVTAGLIKKLSSKADKMGIQGTGSSYQPKGILNTTGIGAVYAGGAASSSTNANGANLVWSDIPNLYKAIAVENADFGKLGYLTNPLVAAQMQTTPRMDNTAGIAILPEGVSTLNSYPLAITNNVPANGSKGSSSGILSSMIFGNFEDLHMAFWGGLDILVNPYSLDTTGQTRINAALFMDSAIARPASFAAIKDITA